MLDTVTNPILRSLPDSEFYRMLVPFALVFVVLAIAPFVLDASETRLLIKILIFALFALGFDILYGYNGVVSFGHAAFFGLGAYLFGIPIVQWGYSNVWLLLLFAVLGTALIGFVIAVISVRTHDIHFAILTLIWALIILLVVENVDITGRHDGFRLALPGEAVPPEMTVIPGMFELPLQDLQTAYFMALVSLALTFLVLYRLVHSPLGAILKGCKANADRMLYVGVDERKIRVVSFTISTAVAGLAGALQAIHIRLVSPSVMDFLLSGEVIVWTILGGAGTLLGPIVGASLVVLAEEFLGELVTWWHIPLGILFILVLIFMPNGIVGKLREIRASRTQSEEGASRTRAED